MEFNLLVIAHPDDETMFFAPALLCLQNSITVLCLSNGDYDGLGKVRERELPRACECLGIDSSRVRILDDPRLRDGPNAHWSADVIADLVQAELPRLRGVRIFTFDASGITRHANHIAAHNGLLRLARRRPHWIQLYTLRSTGLVRRYLGLFDVPIALFGAYARHWLSLLYTHWMSIVCSLVVYFGWVLPATLKRYTNEEPALLKCRPLPLVCLSLRPWSVHKAMRQHRSQYVWFRKLYVLVSRYVWINTFVKVDAAPPSASSSSCTPATTSTNTNTNVIVMSMSRSGTSLATSVIAALLGNQPGSWRGGGAAYPTDSRNRLGYFERGDVVALNYEVLRTLSPGGLSASWTQFPPGFARNPTPLNFSSSSTMFYSTRAPLHVKQRFEAKAKPIAIDMLRHSPFVLKDVRFSRTLPLWQPLLTSNGQRKLACVIPFRHPSEVEQSSRMGGDKLLLWSRYMLAALVSARSSCNRTLLLEYDPWLHEPAATQQLTRLTEFLRCGGVLPTSGPSSSSLAAVRAIVRPAERHHDHKAPKARRSALPPAISCLYDELHSGRALKWPWNAERRAFVRQPCATWR